MTDEPYTPDRGAVRYRYVDGDYSGGNRDPHAEFDRFIAKIKADAIREANSSVLAPVSVTVAFEEYADLIEENPDD